MKTTGAAPTTSGACAASEPEARNDESADGLPELVIDIDANPRAKSNGVDSTDSVDSGLVGDHSSPEHERGHAAGRSNRRRPRGALKIPPYPGFEWVPNQGVNEIGYHYNCDKLSPMADAAMGDCEYGVETNYESHIVYVHVNVGETLSVRVGDEVQHIPGPATVRMITSRQAGPPVPLPLHVPPGHIVQQIVDEYGTLRHLVLSPQTPPTSSATGAFQVVNMANGYASPNVQFLDANASPAFYDGAYSYAVSPDPSSGEVLLDTNSGGTAEFQDVSPVFRTNQEYEDPSLDRNTKGVPFRRPFKQYQSSGPTFEYQARFNGYDGENQFRSVPPRIGGRRKRFDMYRDGRYQTSERFRPVRYGNDRSRFSAKEGSSFRNYRPYQNGYSHPPINTQYQPVPSPVVDDPSPPNPSTVSSHDEDESQKITEMLSRIPPPQVREISARAAFVQWQPFDCSEASANGGSFPQIDASEFTYEVLLFERGTELKQNHRCQAELYPQKWLAELKPACDYFVRLRASLEERGISGEPSPAVAFKTKAAQPEKPDRPDLHNRSKTWVTITWQKPHDNGSEITSYHLEIAHGDEAKFEEVYAGLANEFKIQNLEPATSYKIRLAACNLVGQSEYSDSLIAKTTGGVPSAPEPPVLDEATALTLTLKWKKRECDDEFQLLIGNAKTGHQPIIKTRDVSYTVPNLAPYQNYTFCLAASNDEGCSETSDVVTFRTLPPKPPAPARPMVKKVEPGMAIVVWESETGSQPFGNISYVLEMAKSASKDWVVVCEGAQQECRMPDLEPGSSYHFRLSCRNEGGQSEFSDELEFITQKVAPGPCGAPALQDPPESTALHLKWTPPEQLGGSDIVEYELSFSQPANHEAGSAPSTNLDRIVYRGSSTAYNVSSGLQPGCSYMFRVRAHNAIGAGPWSDIFECETSAAPPECPQRLRLVEVTSRNACLMWEPPQFNNGASVTKYRLYLAYRKAGSVTNSPVHTPTDDLSVSDTPASSETSIVFQNRNTQVPESKVLNCFQRQHSTASTASDDDCVFSTDSAAGAMTEIYAGPELCFDAKSLTPATEYAFCVQAVNAAGESRFSNALFCRTPADVPDVPTILKTDVISSSEILVFWEAPAANGCPILSYHLEILPTKLGGNDSGLTFPVALPSHCRQFAVEGLSPSTAYRFRVQAFNSIGPSDFSASAEATTLLPPPSAPKLELTSATHNSLKLKWSCDSDPAADIIYALEMENKIGAFSPLTTELSSRSYKVIRLNESTVYRFRIRASSAVGGVGEWSDIFSCMTLKSPPTPVKYAPRASNITQTSCEIEWQPVKLVSVVSTNDKVYYDLQIRNVASSSNTTEGVFETMYKGPSAIYHLTGLTPGAAYKVRVSSVRISESGDETESAPSPIATFSTVPPPTPGTAAAEAKSSIFDKKIVLEGLRLLRGNDNQLSDRQWAMLILVGFSMLALLVACLLQRFIPQGSATDDDSSLDSDFGHSL